MSPKRRAGGRGRSSVVARLARRRGRNPFISRSWATAAPVGLQQLALRIGYRPLVALVFVLAFMIGATTSRSVIKEFQGDAASIAPMRVQALAVQGHKRLSAGRIAAASGLATGALASETDAAKITKSLEAHAMIRSAKAVSLPNGKLIVRIEEREPKALLRGPSAIGGGIVWRLVDTTGTPFAPARANDWSRLPRFRSTAVLPTDQADPRLVSAISLAKLVRETEGPDVEAREIELPSPKLGLGWVLHSQNLPRTVILGEGELKPRLEKLALLLASNMPPARAAEEIDLRFADQAVLRSGSPSR